MKTLANIIYWAGIACIVVFVVVASIGSVCKITDAYEIRLADWLRGIGLLIVTYSIICVWAWAKDRRKKS